MIETIFDTLNAKAGIMAYEEYFEESGKEKLPLIVLKIFYFPKFKKKIYLIIFWFLKTYLKIQNRSQVL